MPLINFAPIGSDGRLLVTVQAVPGGPSYLGGFPHDQINNAWACVRFNPPARHLNGMPLDVDGLLVLAPSNSAPTSYSGGIGFAANGSIANSVDAPIARYEGGWPISSEGMICITEVAPAVTVPDPPTGVSGVGIGGNSANISFTAPINNGGAAISFYRAWPSSGSAASGFPPFIEVQGLNPGPNTAFVTCYNEVGESLPSITSAPFNVT